MDVCIGVDRVLAEGCACAFAVVGIGLARASMPAVGASAPRLVGVVFAAMLAAVVSALVLGVVLFAFVLVAVTLVATFKL